MQRYFIDRDVNESESTIDFDKETLHHMLRVMRMGIGSSFYLVDQSQQTFIATITQVNDQELEVSLQADKVKSAEMPVKVTIAVGLPKGDKLEWITQKATELGVFSIIPLDTTRTMVKWKDDKSQKKIQRLQKIAKEAAEQSHRSQIPSIEQVHSLKDLCSRASEYTASLVAFEDSARQGETSHFASLVSKVKSGDSILMIFGPEGGFDQNEIDFLQSQGVVPCGLGPRILRAETAPLYALSAISYQTELINERG